MNSHNTNSAFNRLVKSLPSPTLLTPTARLELENLVSQPPVTSMTDPVETDYYDLLQVSPQASTNEINRQFYKLAMPYHPDICRDPAGHAQARRLYTAYFVLENSRLRQLYNQYGSKGPGHPGAILRPMDLFDRVFSCSQSVDLVGHMPIIDSLFARWIRCALTTIGADAMLSAGSDLSDFSKDQKNHDKRPLNDNAMTAADVQKREDRLKSFTDAHHARVTQVTNNLLSILSHYTNSQGNAAAVEAFQNMVQTKINSWYKATDGTIVFDLCADIFDGKGNEYLGRFSDSTMQSPCRHVRPCSATELFWKHEAYLGYIEAVVERDNCGSSSNGKARDPDVDFMDNIIHIIADAIVDDVSNTMLTVCNEVLYAEDISSEMSEMRAKGLILMAEAINGAMYRDEGKSPALSPGNGQST
ncbi:DnaJ-like protein [Dimargaris xerosporica]|nr:DnaJ-like protein [Dimargaris xerosporica]